MYSCIMILLLNLDLVGTLGRSITMYLVDLVLLDLNLVVLIVQLYYTKLVLYTIHHACRHAIMPDGQRASEHAAGEWRQVVSYG